MPLAAKGNSFIREQKATCKITRLVLVALLFSVFSEFTLLQKPYSKGFVCMLSLICELQQEGQPVKLMRFWANDCPCRPTDIKH